MVGLLTVFQLAAWPQRAVLTALLFAIVAAIALALLELRRPKAWRPWLISQLSSAGPALGLTVGSMNAFHMMDTALRLPVAPSVKDLAPGVREIALLVGLGAAAGLVAVVLCVALNLRTAGAPPATQLS